MGRSPRALGGRGALRPVTLVPMRNRLPMTRATAVAAAAVLTLGLAACSGSDDSGSDDSAGAETSAAEESAAEEDAPADEAAPAGGDICEATSVLEDMSSTLSDVDPTDLQATMDSFEDLVTTVEGVEPPAEIADDWNTIATSFRGMADGLQAAVDDPTDADARSNVQEAMTAISGQEFQDAGQAVSTYTAANC